MVRKYCNSDKNQSAATFLSIFEIMRFSAIACVDGLV